jgi:hypothetical protein
VLFDQHLDHPDHQLVGFDRDYSRCSELGRKDGPNAGARTDVENTTTGRHPPPKGVVELSVALGVAQEGLVRFKKLMSVIEETRLEVLFIQTV